jgi:hypothetical protein
VLPTDDLSSYTVIDVTGWAPTADSAALLVNDCSGDGSYFNIDTGTAGNLIGTDDDTVVAACEAAALLSDTVYCNNAANLALWAMMNGYADVIYIYSDQAYLYKQACTNDADAAADSGIDCDMWEKFGAANGFAYIHSGMPEFAYTGTTLSMSKKGSGLAKVLDPCIKKYLKTKSYYTTCVKWGVEDSCFANGHFPTQGSTADAIYNVPTDEQTDGCTDGYCSCVN